MDLIDKLIEVLNDPSHMAVMSEMYTSLKVVLNDQWKEVDDDTMLSYAKAFCVHCLKEKQDARQQEIFLLSLDMGFAYVGVMDAFADKMNAVTAKVAEPVNKHRLEDLKALLEFKDNSIYKELSKSNKEIIKTIKEIGQFITIEEVKKGKYKNISDYVISKEEVETIERVKRRPELNQLAHSLYDERVGYLYKSNPEIKSDDDYFKRFLVTTNKNNPEYNIVFRDGTIVNYNDGDIRIKPYTFQQILFFTKLFYTSHYEGMKRFYKIVYDMPNDDSITSKMGKSMLISSFTNVMIILRSLEDIYTKKIIDDSKELFVKLKKITKEYNL